jgi:hypothetical protein
MFGNLNTLTSVTNSASISHFGDITTPLDFVYNPEDPSLTESTGLILFPPQVPSITPPESTSFRLNDDPIVSPSSSRTETDQEIRCVHPGCGTGPFSRRYDRDRHMQKHDAANFKFVCKVAKCGKRFHRKDKLKDHMEKGHKKVKKCTCGGRG